jgi:hypothetical protein
MTWAVFELYQHYQSGHLPTQGGVFNQPSWLMAAFAIIAENAHNDEAPKRGH